MSRKIVNELKITIMEDKIFNFLINYFSNINDRGVDEMNNFRGDITSNEVVTWLEGIQSLIDKQPSEDLEEAANAYANEHPGICLENDGGVIDDYDKPECDFIAGAQWQKEKTINKACQWLAGNVINYIWKSSRGGIGISDDFFIDFEKAMEDKQ